MGWSSNSGGTSAYVHLPGIDSYIINLNVAHELLSKRAGVNSDRRMGYMIKQRMAGFTNKQTSYPLCKLLRRSAKHSAQGLHNKCKLLLWLSTLQGSPDKIVNECALTPIQFGGLLSTLVVLLAHRYLSCHDYQDPRSRVTNRNLEGHLGCGLFPHFVRSMTHDSIVEQEHLPLVKGPEPMSHLHEYFIPKGSVINRSPPRYQAVERVSTPKVDDIEYTKIFRRRSTAASSSLEKGERTAYFALNDS
ncbi:hypothetical protein PIIN_01462 [Serendipita indica DSM 11827]|uniref:Uncharacterized protein n=1 Tax=Serendipita indica (strain DSM 11827) TaxID=1109443 RepID=G4T8I6_SERID|nr:hypothetical protein PIIN_01462 [Serendipita indica DSM 11827]